MRKRIEDRAFGRTNRHGIRRALRGMIALLIGALLGACGAFGTGAAPTPEPSATPPAPPALSRSAGLPTYWPTAAWRTSTPEEQGMDSAQLLRALQHAEEAQINLRSLTVIRNGYIVLDAYAQPFTADRRYPVFSVTKSVTALLVGIAFHDGYLSGVRQPVLSFFPERSVANRTADKEAITIVDLLTMQPGLDCADSRIGATVQENQDWVQSILDLPMAEAPGTTFAYCTRGPHLLSAILTKATSMPTEAYAQVRLFDPLGIRPADRTWDADPQGITIGGYGMALRTHDMAKLGLLLLSGGVWDGQQVVPADWLASATYGQVNVHPGQAYGYLFWVYPSNFAAEGLGDQRIMVVPDKNLVVVITSAHDGGEAPVMQPLLTDDIVPAVTANEPLPPNPAAQAALQATVAALANPAQPVPSLPIIAAQIAGTRYRFADNPAGWKTLTLTFAPGSATAQAEITTTAGDRLSLEVGLDNVYRLNEPAQGGQIALRGRWTGDHTFVVHELVMGDINEYDYRLDFSDNQVAVHVEETIFHQFTGEFAGTSS